MDRNQRGITIVKLEDNYIDSLYEKFEDLIAEPGFKVRFISMEDARNEMMDRVKELNFEIKCYEDEWIGHITKIEPPHYQKFNKIPKNRRFK